MYVICHTCGLDINTTASTRTDKSLHLLLQKSSIACQSDTTIFKPKNSNVTNINGRTICSFDIGETLNVKKPIEKNIDLANGKFHILLAKGPLNGENLQFHADKVASEKAITLKEFALIGGASEGWLIQVKKPVSNLSGFPV